MPNPCLNLALALLTPPTLGILWLGSQVQRWLPTLSYPWYGEPLPPLPDRDPA
ncbi:MAG: hypothetical protein Q6J68_03555 [Thermostichales cyanobacterium SZTDM-1c_bins_54]